MWTTDTAKAALSGYPGKCPRGHHMVDLGALVNECDPKTCADGGGHVRIGCPQCPEGENQYDAVQVLYVEVTTRYQERHRFMGNAFPTGSSGTVH
jgi:phage FluMu protein Com